MYITRIILVAMLLLVGVSTETTYAQTVYEGYGKDTRGGLNGKVITVTNLNDSGSGSLRTALAQSGARIIRFNVSGTITLNSDLVIKKPFVTVDGSTAPGNGVQIRNGMIKVRTNDVILRHLKVRPGDIKNKSNTGDRDAISLNGTNVYNIVLDHVSAVWGPDVGGLTILNGAHHITVQDSILGEGLHYSTHPEAVPSQGGHSLAVNISQNGGNIPNHITMVRNLITTADHRMPQVQGAEFVDLVNNVIYNWGKKSAHGNPRSVNLINNYFKSGPMTTQFFVWTPDTSSVAPKLYANSVYESGNIADGFAHARKSGNVYTDTAFPLSVSPMDAQDAYTTVINNAGANLPIRDSADQRIIDNVVNRIGVFLNGVQSPEPRIEWPNL